MITMNQSIIKDFSKLCLHTITTKPWSIEVAIEKYAKAGIKGITVWRQWLEGQNPQQIGENIRAAGLEVVSLARGGFFPADNQKDRQIAIDDNRKIIDEAAALGAPLVVLVCGAVPGQPLAESRKQIQEGVGAIADHAHQLNIKLGIEPLHPMYADDRSAINTLKQANNMSEALNHPSVGVVIDIYHLWWDPELKIEILRCGNNHQLFAFHICDWLTPTKDLLNDRGLMGDGCINIPQIRGWVEKTGFEGFIEVEIFSNDWWQKDQDKFLEKIKIAYLEYS
jgi:sugar phosphate isomerase/epimerase